MPFHSCHCCWSLQIQNVDLVLERGEKLELLVDKTTQLQHQVGGANPPTSHHPHSGKESQLEPDADGHLGKGGREIAAGSAYVMRWMTYWRGISHLSSVCVASYLCVLGQAFKFEKSSKRLRYAMFWNRVKCYGLVALLMAILIFFITGIACGHFDFKHCGSHRRR